MQKIRLISHQSLFVLPALILALVAGYYINSQLITREPEIFFIESESNDLDYRFVIANPPKDGNQLVNLILAHERTFNFPKEKEYYLIYFKETRRSPRNFDSRKDIPTKCHFYEVEPSCMDNGDVIASIFNYYNKIGKKRLHTTIPFTNSKGLKCRGMVFYKDGRIMASGCEK